MVLPSLAPLAVISESAETEGDKADFAENPPVRILPFTLSAREMLVVEDERIVAELIRGVLREDGHTVDIVCDGNEGLLRLSEKPYDLIVCGLRVPRFSGLTFYETLINRSTRGRGEGSASALAAGEMGQDVLPNVLFITGDTLAELTIRFLEGSGLPWLAKPFRVEELRSAIAGALSSNIMPTENATHATQVSGRSAP